MKHNLESTEGYLLTSAFDLLYILDEGNWYEVTEAEYGCGRLYVSWDDESEPCEYIDTETFIEELTVVKKALSS